MILGRVSDEIFIRMTTNTSGAPLALEEDSALEVPEEPEKEEDDQDINQFEILKGELLCGNDGNETIKKFKVLVMRMMNKGLLPKGQAKEILLDLATMGY